MSYVPFVIKSISIISSQNPLASVKFESLDDLFSDTVDVHCVSGTMIYKNSFSHHFDKKEYEQFSYEYAFNQVNYPFSVTPLHKSNKEVFIDFSIRTAKPFYQHKDEIMMLMSRLFGRCELNLGTESSTPLLSDIFKFQSHLLIQQFDESDNEFLLNQSGVLNITITHVGHDCSTCGGDYADGCEISLFTENNVELVLDFSPKAHCYDSLRFDEVECLAYTYHVLGGENSPLFKLSNANPESFSLREQDMSKYKCDGCFDEFCYCSYSEIDKWEEYFKHFGWSVSIHNNEYPDFDD